jgi:predicted RNA-binding protein YlqC (UPF0109 family)
MQAFLEYAVKGLVDRPEAVTVTEVDNNGGTIYELRLHPTDVGKIIGRQGNTIHALRSLVMVGIGKLGKNGRCSVEIVEDETAEEEEAPAEEASESEA